MAQFRPARQLHAALARRRIGLAPQAPTLAMGIDLPRPHGADARHQQRADQHHRQRAAGRIEHAHQALVAGKQAIDLAGGRALHREQPPRHVRHAAQRAGQRHVHAVIVARRQVHGAKLAVGELAGQREIAAQQLRRGERAALGLQQLVAIDMAAGANRAVRRADQRALVTGQRAGTVPQRAGEETHEIRIGARVRLRRVGQIDLVGADQAIDQQLLEPRLARTGQVVDEARDRVMRQQPRRQAGELIGKPGHDGHRGDGAGHCAVLPAAAPAGRAAATC